MLALMVTHMTDRDSGGMADRVRGLTGAFTHLGHEIDTMILPINKHRYSNRFGPWWYLRPTREWTESAIAAFPCYDLIVASYLPVALAASRPASDPRIRDIVKDRLVYDAHNDEARLASLNRPRRHREVVRRAEDTVIRAFAATWVAGTGDRDSLAERHASAKLLNVPNGVETPPNLTGVKVSVGEAFVYGSWTYPPNVEGLRALASVDTDAHGHVRVFGRVPENLRHAIERLVPRQPGVRWTFEGFRPNLEEVMRCGGVGMVPVWSGGGTKLRTVQLLGTGIPAVITSEAASGLPSWIREYATLVETPDAMLAAALGHVVAGKDVRALGRSRILTELSWDAVATEALRGMSSVLAAETSNRV